MATYDYSCSYSDLYSVIPPSRGTRCGCDSAETVLAGTSSPCSSCNPCGDSQVSTQSPVIATAFSNTDREVCAGDKLSFDCAGIVSGDISVNKCGVAIKEDGVYNIVYEVNCEESCRCSCKNDCECIKLYVGDKCIDTKTASNGTKYATVRVNGCKQVSLCNRSDNSVIVDDVSLAVYKISEKDKKCHCNCCND